MGFGDFNSICQKTPLPLCSLVGSVSPLSGATGIDTTCYARSVEVGNTIIFEAATDFMHILALIMTAIMILHVRSKFTAVGTSSGAARGECEGPTADPPARPPQVARRSASSSTSTRA